MKKRIILPYYAALTRELDIIKRSPLLITIGLILPIFTFLFFTFFLEKGVPTDIPIGMVDNDNSVLSRKLIEMVETTSEVAITTQPLSIHEGQSQIEKNEIQGLIVIPKGFSKGIKKGTQPQVVFYYNNQYIITGGNLYRGVTSAVLTFSAGISITSMVKQGESFEEALAQSVPITTLTSLMFNPETNYFYYLATVLLPVMLLMFVMQITVFSIGSELKNGTAKEWLNNSDNIIALALAGKLTPYVISFSIQTIFMNVLLFQYFQIPVFGPQFLLHLGALVMMISYIAIGIFIISIFPSLRMALSITSIYAALAFSFSGLTFPFMSMPPLAQHISEAFPLTHYVRILITKGYQDAPDYYLLLNFGALVAFCILPYLTLGRLEKMALNEKYWHKL